MKQKMSETWFTKMSHCMRSKEGTLRDQSAVLGIEDVREPTPEMGWAPEVYFSHPIFRLRLR